MLEHPLSPATRTVELAQLTELREVLTGPRAVAVTAADLGLHESSPAVPAASVLTGITYEGPPGYPYVHGYFAAGPGVPGSAHRVLLHTAALRALSHRLQLHHSWGV